MAKSQISEYQRLLRLIDNQYNNINYKPIYLTLDLSWSIYETKLINNYPNFKAIIFEEFKDYNRIYLT